jgi:hypothetical protein
MTKFKEDNPEMKQPEIMKGVAALWNNLTEA